MTEERNDTQYNESDRWIDPDPEGKGMLLSDRIHYYVEKTRMVENFDPECLKDAAYYLRIGSLYYLDGKFGQLSDKKPELVIQPNSLVFVSTLEKINLPYYIGARFNLRIKLVYQGILLGTGPQVDPGFRGYLSCPLHNLSNNKVTLKYKDTFATMDFIKTTRFGKPQIEANLRGLDETRLHEEGEPEGIEGFDGKRCRLFPENKWNRTLYDYMPPGKIVLSSIKDLGKRVKWVQRLRTIEYIVVGTIVIGIAGLSISLARHDYAYIQALQTQLQQQAALLQKYEEIIKPAVTKTESERKTTVEPRGQLEDSVLGGEPSSKTEPSETAK